MADRVVYDCMVFLQAAARPEGPAAACLNLAELGQVELCLSADVLAEIQDVLTRPKVRAKFPSLTNERVGFFLEALARLTTIRPASAAFMKLVRDPKDEKYLNLAAEASANFLVSRDKDLLELNDPANPESAAVFQKCPALKIVTPEEFLRILRPRPAPQNGPPTEMPAEDID